ncbi:ABC transporter permease [Oceanirhabdus seepicola]|uniref:ABC-2 family transporter protein n=1 Tax=Oceanirhabdus seepicola TaxID=2828781 RepID=A0A9J6NZB0_9CLOT|nr:ABC-2 family transporter protein [Oceanirhabdus seepicola]MCM1988941.1 ABC-2 family transporter protein [Oceanirhabdus seepicola]
MNILYEYIKLNLKVLFQHKRAFFIMFFVNSAVVMIYLPLFRSIYAYNNSQNIKGYSLEQMVWYFAAVTFVNTCVHSYADSRISTRIRNGNLSIDLLKPVGIMKIELGQGIGLKIPAILIQFMLPFLVYSLVIFPTFITFNSVFKFIILNIGGFAIAFLTNYIIGLTAFYIKNNNSIIRLKGFLFNFAGGAFIPLDFFPNWANTVLDILPFKYVYYWPIQFFLNSEKAQGTFIFYKIFFIQLLWSVVLFILGKFLYNKVIKNYCAVGG